MKVRTKEQYNALQQKRHKPEPKKGKSRKVSVEKESNVALVKKLKGTTAERNKTVGTLNVVVRVLDRALGLACAPRGLVNQGKTAKEYCDDAKAELVKEAENVDAKG